MSKDMLSSEERSFLQVIVANPGSAEAAAALAELDIRSRKASESINKRMLILTIVLALAAIGQVTTGLIPIFSHQDRAPVCTCKHGNDEVVQRSPPSTEQMPKKPIGDGDKTAISNPSSRESGEK